MSPTIRKVLRRRGGKKETAKSGAYERDKGVLPAEGAAEEKQWRLSSVEEQIA